MADDIGSIALTPDGDVVVWNRDGAFVRLDDLQAGYAFGQMDRTIIMNPDQVNARVVLPVTRYEYLIKGIPVDAVLYANNYEMVDEEHKLLRNLPHHKMRYECSGAGL